MNVSDHVTAFQGVTDSDIRVHFCTGVSNIIFLKEYVMSTEAKTPIMPQHVGIIMDGNGRWAKKRGLPRPVGHTYGAKTFKEITRYISKQGVKYLTLYAFSTENWKRPQEEVGALMKIFRQLLVEALSDFRNDDIKVCFIGDLSVFDDDILKLIEETNEVVKNRQGMVLNLAVNYGGRSEIINAVKRISAASASGEISSSDINEELFERYLYTAGQPDPDLIIRTGGEHRLSNFLMYQSAYSEFYSTDTLWPDFKPEDFDKAVAEFNKRNRRFGGV